MMPLSPDAATLAPERRQRLSGRVAKAFARSPAHILIARPDHLGDLLLTLPAISALRRALPDAQITFLVPAGLEAVPAHCPDVDQTYAAAFPPLLAPLDRSGWDRRAVGEASALRGHFDLVLLPRPDDPWSGALVGAAAIPVRLGYAAPRTRPYLTAALPVPAHRHVARVALDLAAVAAALLGAPDAVDAGAWRPVRFVPTPADQAEARAVLATTPAGDAPIVLHPGSGWPLKDWSADRWGVLARALARRYHAPVLVVGTAREGAFVAAVVTASGGDACGVAGRLSLGGLAAFQRRARLVVATDSGALHLAAAVGTPVVGLYGPADPAEFGPWCPPERQRIVRVPLPCSPCRTLVDPPCGATREPACVATITVDAVLAAAADFLDARPVPVRRSTHSG